MDPLNSPSALGRQPIIFMPGLDGTGISFEPLAELLPPDASVKIVRYPPDRFLDFDETVRCARDQIQPCDEGILIAESFSGPVAVALVSTGQVKAKGLILCCTFARSPRPLLWKTLGRLPLARLLRLPPPRCLLKHLIEGGDPPTDLFLALWQRVKALVPAEVLVHRLRILSEVDVRPHLPRLKIPCLYLQATGDRTVPPRSLFDFTEAVPDLRVRRIRGPHFLLQAQPGAALVAIEDFAAWVTAPSLS